METLTMNAMDQEPTAQKIRAIADCEHNNTVAAAIIKLVIASAAYGSSLALILAMPGFLLKLPFIILNGVLIFTMLTVAHDACHGSLTRHPLLNKILARIAFLPPLTPYSTWELIHNRLHHTFNNLRGHDYGWMPLSFEEYQKLGPVKRFLQRSAKTVSGLWIGILVEYWLKHIIFPRKKDMDRIKNKQLLAFDIAITIAYFFLAVAMIRIGDNHLTALLGRSPTSFIPLMLEALVLPYIISHYTLSFVSFQQHTHPKTMWYSSKEEWNNYRAWVRSTVHIRLPKWAEIILNNIMIHNAHHIDMKVSACDLPKSQKQLEEKFDEMIVEDFSFKAFLNKLKVCRLYDYKNHQWLDFDGTPTSPSMCREEVYR